MKEALLYDKTKGDSVRCNVCQRRCIISEGQAGYCRTRVNKGGKLYTTIYGITSSVCADPIEKKPVYHYKPGSLAFSMGTFGCNFRCSFCQNWDISYTDASDGEVPGKKISPEESVNLALKYNCQGIAYTYNEPTIWLEYTLDSMKEAKKLKEKGRSLYTCYVTNGFITDEALDLIGPYLDIFRVDIKSMENHFYQKLIKVPKMEGILDSTKRAKEKWEMHIEVVSNIVPTWNDSEENLKKTASWMVKNLGEKTPWHVTRFFPYANLQNIPPTPIETLEKIIEIGKKEGLKFIYIGNVPNHPANNTYCPNCGELVIERSGYNVRVVNLSDNGKCGKCNEDLGIVV